MSETTSAPATEGGSEQTSGATPPAGGEFTPITSQADLDRIIGQRLERERARYADYADLKAKAEKVGEVETAAEERQKEVEAALAGIPAKVTEALRSHLVAVHGIEKDDADLFLTATDPDTLLKQVDRLAGRITPARLHVPGEGKTPGTPKPDEERAAVRALFGTGGTP